MQTPSSDKTISLIPALSRFRASCLACVICAGCCLAAAGVQSAQLDSEADRVAFRNWFAFLVEAQYFTPPSSRAPEIIDCSSLVRYAYREALRRHDSLWAAGANLPLIPAIPSVLKYSYPRTPNGPRIFAIAPQQYGEFADAQTLYRYNSFRVASDIRRASRGDLLFFRQATGKSRYHTMIILDSSHITREPSRFVLYDTGPDGSEGGEIKRLTMADLLHYPDPRWRPVPENSAFLGVFRWNILKD